MNQLIETRKGVRCPKCYWALYDGIYCQGPNTCPNRGKRLRKPIMLTNAEAQELIQKANQ